MKIRPAIKQSCLFRELEDMKSWYYKIIITCENNYSRIAVSQSAPLQMFDKVRRVLNNPGFWICLLFWMFQSFGYTRILNMPRLHRVQNMLDQFLNMLDYFWKCLNIPECAGICVDIPNSAWIDYVPHFLICFTIRLLLEHVVPYLSVYKILEVARNMRLFSRRDKIWFFYSSWKYLIWFLF